MHSFALVELVRIMSVHYKITATIIKPGNLPVQWTRYSRKKMTQFECEKMFTIPKEPGRSFGDKVRVENLYSHRKLLIRKSESLTRHTGLKTIAWIFLK